MAGKTGSGRRTSTPSAMTRWRRKEKAKSISAATVPGVPPLPKKLAGEAALMWPLLIGQLQAAGILSELDGPALRACCECWGLYCSAIENCKADPKDTDAANNLGKFQKAFEAWVSRLGLSPTDRARITAPQSASNDFERFLASRPE